MLAITHSIICEKYVCSLTFKKKVNLLNALQEISCQLTTRDTSPLTNT